MTPSRPLAATRLRRQRDRTDVERALVVSVSVPRERRSALLERPSVDRHSTILARGEGGRERPGFMWQCRPAPPLAPRLMRYLAWAKGSYPVSPLGAAIV